MAARAERETKPAAGEVPTSKAVATDANARWTMMVCLLRMVGTEEGEIVLCEARSIRFFAPPKDRERCHDATRRSLAKYRRANDVPRRRRHARRADAATHHIAARYSGYRST